ncbi:TPA: hypothetical protein R4X15_003915 [Citrobacter amalonaticus]|nr:hypothetical protein [Citrobacter amalonaticus]
MRITIHKPIVIFIALLMLTFIFWDWLQDNIAVVGGLATAFAFLATAWTAFEAKASARAAMKATQLTSESLLEMKKSSFKDWLEMLLSQHEKIHQEVVLELLKKDSDFNVKLELNFADAIYYSLAKKQLFTRYVSHFISILEYIDKEFYLSSNADGEREQYIEQLQNRVNQEVKMVIAILGLNIRSTRTYNASKLNMLLNKYHFFKNDCFFTDAHARLQWLHSYILELFTNEYRKSVEYYVNENIKKYKKGIRNPINDQYFDKHQKIKFVLFWSYDNLCRGYLEEMFSKLPTNVRNGIYISISEAVQKKEDIEQRLSQLIGFTVPRANDKIITIKNQRDILLLLRFYLRFKDEIKLNNIIFSGRISKVYGNELTKTVHDYEFFVALLRLARDDEKEKVIDEIIDVAIQMRDYYVSRLDDYSFRKKENNDMS